jgi:hypothetical protein
VKNLEFSLKEARYDSGNFTFFAKNIVDPGQISIKTEETP